MFKTIFFSQPGHLILQGRGEQGRQPPANHDVTKENQGQANQQCKYNTVLLTNWTEICTEDD